MDKKAGHILRSFSPTGARKMDRGLKEEEELTERCREAFEDAGMLAIDLFGETEFATEFHVHCQQMIHRITDREQQQPSS